MPVCVYFFFTAVFWWALSDAACFVVSTAEFVADKIAFHLPCRARYVRLQLDNDWQALHIAQLCVFSPLEEE